MDIIIKELDALIGRNILSADSILFLDEIQATPHAIQALHYFYEDKPDLPVIPAKNSDQLRNKFTVNK